jgi:hypothetical protein
MELGQQVRAVVDQLTAAGIRATADAADLNLPAVLVKPPELDFRFKAGTEQGTWAIYALVPDTLSYTALDTLGDLIDRTRAALAGKVATGRPVDFITLEGVSVPGYELTFTTRTR